MHSLKEMLLELIKAGDSQSGLARKLGTTQSTIHRIVEKNQGASYELGKKVEQLYGKHVESLEEKKAA